MQPFFILQAFTLHFHAAEKQQESMLTLLFHANVTCMRWGLFTFSFIQQVFMLTLLFYANVSCMRAASDFLFHGARKQPECMLT